MDGEPFFILNLEALRKSDIAIVERFTKANFDTDTIMKEASNLKTEHWSSASLIAEDKSALKEEPT